MKQLEQEASYYRERTGGDMAHAFFERKREQGSSRVVQAGQATGSVLICDTQRQVERFVQLFDGNQQLAISAVNTEEHNPNACAMVDAAYVLGPQLGLARSRSHAFEITSVVVVGTATPRGYRSVKPAIFFTPVKVNEFAV